MSTECRPGSARRARPGLYINLQPSRGRKSMQPNPIIIEEGPAPLPDADFGDEAAALASAQSQLMDANVLPFHREFAAADYDLSILPDTAIERVMGGRRSLYAMRPAGQRLVYRATKRGVDV